MLRSVILPAYNEAGYIAEMVEGTVAAMSRRPDPFEVIVVDNASTDGTFAVVNTIAARDERVRVIRHDRNMLYAGSCMTGTRASRGDRVFIIDSDGQHPPSDLWAFDARLDEGCDLVLGWRRVRADGMLRRAASHMLLWHARIYLGFDLHDVNCGIRAFGRRFAHTVLIRHRVNLVNPELYVRARIADQRICEVGVTQLRRRAGRSSQDLLRPWRVLWSVNRYFWSLRGDLSAARSRDLA